MATLAVASVMMVLASHLSDFTGGEDGIIHQIPRFFLPAQVLLADEERKALYYFVFFAALALFVAMAPIVASPLGSVLEAIRENEMRAEAIGYRVVGYRTAVFCIAAVIAALAGALRAVCLKYTGPECCCPSTSCSWW